MTRILIMAGGTGGHVCPALAVAEELRAQGVTVTWLGTKAGIESRLVPQNEFDIDWLTVQGLRSTGVWRMVQAPFRLCLAMVQAALVMIRRKPDAVLGMGGFASGPGGLVAWLFRKPLLLHEQNSVPGLTNRMLAVFARRVMLGFPGAFAQNRRVKAKSTFTGNPVARQIELLSASKKSVADASRSLRVLVLGGSQGAVVLNEVMPDVFASAKREHPDEEFNVEIWHQCGENNLSKATEKYQRLGVVARIDGFIDHMAEAYDWADVVISRAGALTVSELSAAGLPSILVPLPTAVDDHQTHNARYLESHGAAIVMPQAELCGAALESILRDFAVNREKLTRMSENARGLLESGASSRVAQICLEACHA